MELVKPWLPCLTIIATILQVVGTVLIAWFSFRGLSIEENREAYAEGIQKVSVVKRLLDAARLGTVLLVLGLLIGGFASWASLGAI